MFPCSQRKSNESGELISKEWIQEDSSPIIEDKPKNFVDSYSDWLEGIHCAIYFSHLDKKWPTGKGKQ